MTLLKTENLKVYYNTMKGTVKAVDDVSFSINEGEILGIAGESGCGKTSLALSIPRLLPSNAKIVSGEILFNERNLLDLREKQLRKIRWKEISMIFQNSMNSLNPVKTIGDQISEPITIHESRTKHEIKSRVKELLEMVGIDPSRMRNFPHEFSGGMRQRVIIAMSIALDPKLILADEPVTALDVMVQAQILDLMGKLQKELNSSVILISHDLSIIADSCDKIVVMYAGKIVESGDVELVYNAPLHPYTQRLLKAFPRIEGPLGVMESIPGTPPDLLNPPKGCRFNPRCPLVMDKCKISVPPLLEVRKNHKAACFAI
jgi:peptide/nickel transport system ATP-binding protein